MKLRHTAILPISVFVLFFLLLAFTTAQASDETAIRDAIKKAGGSYMRNIQVYTTQVSGNWGLSTITYEMDGKTWRNSALLKKAGSKWELQQFTGQGATTDLLKQNAVPAVHWEPLLGKESIARFKPMLTYLHKRLPGYSVESIRISGEWITGTWYAHDSGGMLLAKRQGSTWKLIEAGGGVMDETVLKSLGVPAAHRKRLLGIE